MGNFVQIFLSNFHSHFLSNLERLCFGGGGEKTSGSHQNLSSFPPSTKQPKTSFSLHFSLFHFPSSLKSLQTNIALWEWLMGQVSTSNHLACMWKVEMRRRDSIREEGGSETKRSKKSSKKHCSYLEQAL